MSDSSVAAHKTPIKVPKMAEIVLAHLRSEIVDGHMPTGSNLPTEGELVERFGVSRATIREAVRVLETEGYVATKRGLRSGAQILAPSTRITARQMALQLRQKGALFGDVYAARLIIEPAAARLLAENSSPEALGRLRDLLSIEREAIDDPVAWGSAAGAFHMAVIDLCGNVTIAVIGLQLHEIVESQIETEMSHGHAARKKKHLVQVDDAHAKLIALIEAGQAAEAEAFWREHLEAARPWHILTNTVSVDDLFR